MKKVLNWTIGSFFRTIGRTIAFLVMGGLIYYILTYNGFGIEDLFLTKVNASTFDYAYETYYSNEQKTNTLPEIANSGNDNYKGYTINNVYGSQTNYNFYHGSRNITGYDSIRYYYYFSNGSQINNSPSSEISISARMISYTADNGYQYNECTQHAISGSSQYGYLDCHLVSGAYRIEGVQTFVSMESSDPTNYKFGLNPVISFVKSEGSQQDIILSNINNSINNQSAQQHQDSVNTQNAIVNQTIQDQQQHEELMDDNTTQAEDEATDFFQDFSVPDVGGLSAIITAPLNTIRSLLNSTCTPLVLPLPYVNKNLTLPCLTTIYTQHFGAFFTLYQTIILAIVAYRCIRSIFFDIHGFTDPSDDRIEVMDL